MNSRYFGDSYDIVKRFFIKNINEMGYKVFADPMFTDNWNGLEEKFYEFIGALPLRSQSLFSGPKALFLDPDTGIGAKLSKQHVTIEEMVKCLKEYHIVFSYDQSFSRNISVRNKISEKLSLLKKNGAKGFYYESHACFLFSAKSEDVLMNLKHHFAKLGLPESRFIFE